MKVTRTSKRSGSAMILALFAFLFMAGIGGAIFSLTLAGARTTRTASMGDGSYHVAEAGIDDAINKMRAYLKAPDNKTADWYDAFANPTKDANGDPVNVITGSIRGGTYTVTITPFLETNALQNYTISSVGHLAGQKRGIRTIVAAEEKPGAFKYGLFGKDSVTVAGNLITDSYKSTDDNGALWKYTDQDLNKAPDGTPIAGAKGNVGSNGTIEKNGGGGPAPKLWVNGTGTPGPGFKISDADTTSFLATSTTDTELELSIKELSTPQFAEQYNFPAKVKGVEPPAIITASDGHTVYKISELTKGITINTNGLDVKLYVEGNIILTDKTVVNVTGGGTLEVYQNIGDALNSQFGVHGQALVNANGTPKATTFYTNVNKATINGGSGFTGVLYAPNTAITLNGGANNFGALIGKTIKATGAATFHYDERLADLPTGIIEINVKSVDQFVPSSKD